jgi:hypothetical protein
VKECVSGPTVFAQTPSVNTNGMKASDKYTLKFYASSHELLRPSVLIMLPTAVAHHVTRHNTPIHSILWTALQLSISQNALGTLPGNGTVMPKRVGATIHN